MHRDDVDHKGEKVNWGKWAITCDDPDFGGEGSPDTGDDYGPAPGKASNCSSLYQKPRSSFWAVTRPDLVPVLRSIEPCWDLCFMLL